MSRDPSHGNTIVLGSFMVHPIVLCWWEWGLTMSVAQTVKCNKANVLLQNVKSTGAFINGYQSSPRSQGGTGSGHENTRTIIMFHFTPHPF